MNVETALEDILGEGFNLFKKQYAAFIIATIIAIVGSVFIITAPPLFFGLYYMGIRATQGKKVQTSDVFKGFDYFIRSWVMVIIGFAAIAIGFVFLVIPGLFLMVVFQYAAAIAISENKGGIEALQKSFEIGKNNLIFSIVLFILTTIINSIGSSIALGALVTLPFTLICICIATQKLTKGK